MIELAIYSITNSHILREPLKLAKSWALERMKTWKRLGLPLCQ